MATRTYDLEVLSTDFAFLEGPRWYDNRLWVSDMRAGTIFAVDEHGTRSAVATVEGWPSGLGFLPDGTLLAVGMNDQRLYKVRESGLECHCDLSATQAGPLNDMVISRAGRAYVGHIGYNFFAGEQPAPGVITLIDIDGSARQVASGLSCPNGMALRADERTLCVAESFANRVIEFNCDSDGNLSDARVLIELPNEVPDGLCLDQDGGLWVACFQGRRFVHVDRTGRIIAEIKVPNGNAVACQLGGADGRTLFCLTYYGTTEEMISGVPGARIEVTRVEVPAGGSP